MKRFVIALCLVLLTLPIFAQDDAFTLTILHTSNVVGQHEAGSDDVGGTARVATLVNEIRATVDNVLLLDAGDRFINPILAAINAEMMNSISYNTMTLGNHEFNGANEGVAALVESLTFPIVAANVDFSQSDILAGTVEPYIILEVGGEQIGIIGLANETAPILSSPGTDLIFLDDETQITQEVVSELQGQGVNKIILIAHREANENAVLASAVSGVDVIVGGSDNILLSNSEDSADAPYPIVAESLSGEPVLVVQTTEGNRHLGNLMVTFDANGVITSWEGDNRLLTPDIAINETIEAIVQGIAEAQAAEAIVIGETEVELIGGDSCRETDCTLGMLIADTMRQQANTDITVFNSGGIRADIPVGSITDAQVLEVLPFGNRLSRLELQGVDVLALLEHSVSLGGDASVRGSGRFLQISGMRFSWDPTRPEGSRVVEVEIQNRDGNFEMLDIDAIYSVAANDFIRGGGDDFSVLAQNAIDPFDFGPQIDQMVIAYIRANSPIILSTEARITRIGE